MKKIYTKPEICSIEFDTKDIIRTSEPSTSENVDLFQSVASNGVISETVNYDDFFFTE